VRDETRHARFGWQLLEWVEPRLGCDRANAAWARGWARSLRQPRDNVGRAGGIADGGGLGWIRGRHGSSLPATPSMRALARHCALRNHRDLYAHETGLGCP